MKWITRQRPKVDRVACPWLIARFIDPEAEFIFAPPAEVAARAVALGATPFDIEGVDLSHDGSLCTFDALLARFALTDPALHEIAAIVRGADTARLDLAPQARRTSRDFPGAVVQRLRRSRTTPARVRRVRRAVLVEPPRA